MNNNYVYGKKITDLYVQSVFIKDKLSDEFNVVFLKIEFWFEIILNEGLLTIRKLDDVLLLPLDAIDDDFKYPVQNYSYDKRFSKIIGCKLTDLKLMKYEDGDDYYGMMFIFDNAKYLYYYEDLHEEKCVLTTKDIIIPNNIDYIEYNFLDIQ